MRQERCCNPRSAAGAALLQRRRTTLPPEFVRNRRSAYDRRVTIESDVRIAAIPRGLTAIGAGSAPFELTIRVDRQRRRHRGRRGRAARLDRPGALRAAGLEGRIEGVQRLLRHALPAAQARQHRVAGQQPVLRRDGELGRDLHLRVRAAARPKHRRRSATSRHLRRRPRTRSRTSGSATWSPWPGGTTCGSTRASPRGWSHAPPSTAPRMEDRAGRRRQRAKARCGCDADRRAPIRSCSTWRPSSRPTRRSTPSPTQKGAAVIRMLEAYVGRDAFRERRARLHARPTPTATPSRDDLWRAVEAAASKPMRAHRARTSPLQAGVPLVRVGQRHLPRRPHQSSLRQGEFTVDRPDKAPLHWNVPVIARGPDRSSIRTTPEKPVRRAMSSSSMASSSIPEP